MTTLRRLVLVAAAVMSAVAFLPAAALAAENDPVAIVAPELDLIIGSTSLAPSAEAPLAAASSRYSFTPDGQVIAHNGAVHYGDVRRLSLWQPIVDLIETPTGNGYWLVARDSGVFAFGDAPYRGNLIDQLTRRDNLAPGTLHGGNVMDYLHGEIATAAAAPDGYGYYLLGADGGVFNFGTARFHGSVSGQLPAGWRHHALVMMPDADGYRIDVFVWDPEAIGEFHSGTTVGITQSYRCSAGTCHFTGQQDDVRAIPGVERATIDYAAHWNAAIAPSNCAAQVAESIADRTWYTIDDVVEWLAWIHETGARKLDLVATVRAWPWPAQLVDDMQTWASTEEAIANDLIWLAASSTVGELLHRIDVVAANTQARNVEALADVLFRKVGLVSEPTSDSINWCST